MSEREAYNPGDTYVFGIRAKAEEKGISFAEAAEILRQDLLDTGSHEHLKPLEQALKFLESQDNN